MRSDGDPDPDDYGLPRVDIVVPDDARELDRDVVAYRREERGDAAAPGPAGSPVRSPGSASPSRSSRARCWSRWSAAC
ncbi:hypothetical protein [Actinomadura sp. CNU-125]|uniref:hypothetical protein n=1 Tax=Actinomadura sp. CNU-125 TaxID=1904961 RepID=UPI0021CCB956|nr:hypothetical protein [Actinomadura sp. CNU-125]